VAGWRSAAQNSRTRMSALKRIEAIILPAGRTVLDGMFAPQNA
jgi:hypothetical protein